MLGVGVGVLLGRGGWVCVDVGVNVWSGVDVLLAVGVSLGVGRGVLLAAGAGVLEGVGGGVGVALGGGAIDGVGASTSAGVGVSIGTLASLTGGVSVMRSASRCSAVSASAPQIQPGSPRAIRAALESGPRSASPRVPRCTATTPYRQILPANRSPFRAA